MRSTALVSWILVVVGSIAPAQGDHGRLELRDLDGHKIEAAFWDALNDIATARGMCFRATT